MLENSKPAIQFDGVDDNLANTAFSLDETSDLSTAIVSKFNSLLNTQYLYASRKTTDNRSSIGIGAGNGILSYQKRTNTIITKSISINSSQNLIFTENTSPELYVNNNASTATQGIYNSGSDNSFYIGSNGNNTQYLSANVQELVFWQIDQSDNRQDIEKNIADYYEITISGNSGVESWVKNVSFADMYQIWFDYEYLHRLFANFEIPNQVHKILAYSDELTADQKQQVYDYLQKNYHPIYTPYSTRVLADGGTLAAGQTNTLTIIDSI